MSDKPYIDHQYNRQQIVAGDGCFLRELLHPDRDPVNVRYSLAYAYIEPNGATADHWLEQTETYYILSGHGTMMLDDQEITVQAGSYYSIPPRCHQWLRNDADIRLEFLCIVDPPWTAEGEVIVAHS